MSDAAKEATLARLCHAIQALALPAEQQLRLFPEYAATGDELILDFDNFYQAASGSLWWHTVQPQARASIDALASDIEGLIELYDETMWSDEAVSEHACWSKFRTLAADALRACALPQQLPPSYRHEFVRADPKSAV